VLVQFGGRITDTFVADRGVVIEGQVYAKHSRLTSLPWLITLKL
jgi:hypothetical protein